ncbi:hypothetical protein HDU76_010989 [Blyttiomyces sp. JEL0837]|nr:hypothetical protein HDU76_010989 [Blyttiomyces sp. JEL0837]
MLDRDGDEVARATTLVRYHPNSKFPTHTHSGGEEFIVLEGTFIDDGFRYTTGTYARNPIGSSHAPWVESDGCLILVKLRWMNPDQPHVFIKDATSLDVSTLIKTETNNASTTSETHLPNSKLLFKSPNTPEVVRISFILPNGTLPIVDEEATKGGLEVFVLEGEVSWEFKNGGEGGQENKKDEVFGKYGWLRFPPLLSKGQIQDQKIEGFNIVVKSLTGAKVFVKSGHLSEHIVS